MKEETRKLYPPDWPEISRRTIEERGGRCESCGQSRELGAQVQNPLTVHHIDYNPANNEPSNLVVLCAACHLTRQNKERRYWHGKPVPKEQLRLPLFEEELAHD